MINLLCQFEKVLIINWISLIKFTNVYSVYYESKVKKYVIFIKNLIDIYWAKLLNGIVVYF